MITAKAKAGVAAGLTARSKRLSCAGGQKTSINSIEGENHITQTFPLEKSGVLCGLLDSASPHAEYPQYGLFEALIVGERVRPNEGLTDLRGDLIAKNGVNHCPAGTLI
jgi:hypothetical protein